MTVQFPDGLAFEGRRYALIYMCSPLESYFDEDHPRPAFISLWTCNHRGYTADWEIKNNILYLTDIRGRIQGDDEDFSFDGRRYGINDLFPGAGSRVEATWFTGTLRLPRGKKLEHACKENIVDIFEKEILLTIELGKLVGSQLTDNRQLDAKAEKRHRAENRKLKNVIYRIKVRIEILLFLWSLEKEFGKLSWMSMLRTFFCKPGKSNPLTGSDKPEIKIRKSFPNRGRILVVEHDEAVREVIEKTLDSVGFETHVAVCAEKALAILDSISVDLVISEVMLPAMSGLELTSLVKKNFDSDVIIMTGYKPNCSYEKAIEIGACDFFYKPIKLVELQKKVEQVIDRRKNR